MNITAQTNPNEWFINAPLLWTNFPNCCLLLVSKYVNPRLQTPQLKSD